MKHIICLFLFTCLCFSIKAQSTEDSLIRVLNSANTDTSRIQILQQLYYEVSNNPIKSKTYALDAFLKAKELDPSPAKSGAFALYADYLFSQANFDSAVAVYNDALGIAREIKSTPNELDALFGLGNSYLRKGNFTKAKDYHFQKLEIAEAIQDKESMAGSYNSLGLIETELGNFSKAMEYFTLSSQLFQEADNLDHYATTLMSIGLVLRQLGDYEASEKYYLESDSINKLLNDLEGRAYAYQNLAIIKKNTNNLSESMEYNRKALKSFQELGNLKKVGEIHYTNGSLAIIAKDYPKALNAFSKSLEYAEITNDSTMIAFANTYIGHTHIFLENFEAAEKFLLIGLSVSKDIDLEIMEKDAYEFLSLLYDARKDYKNAYHYRLMFEDLKDSLYTRDRRDLASEIEARYQNDQKEKEIKLLEKEKEVQNLQLTKRVNERNAIIAFTIAMLVLAGLLYNQYKIKQKANRKLLELDRLKSNFFANISHEFRTPLTLIKGPIDHVLHNPDEELGRENAEMISRNTSRVLKLVNQLLDLSRIDEGSLQLTPSEGDVLKCLRSTASSFNSLATARSMDYRVYIPHGELRANFDRDKLEKVLYNLLGNAFKFSDQGALITCDASCTNGTLKVEIADTGIGIPKDNLPFIFDRFYQVDGGTSKEQEGTGIGLSLSKELVELMGGTLTVWSELNKGSKFTMFLPLHEIKTHVKTGKKAKAEQVNTIRQNAEIRIEKEDARDVPSILMVEDNADMRQFIRDQMISAYKVFEAIDGEMGYNKSVSLQPDLIITDLMMPKLDGIELCKRLKTNVDTSHIPIIMLTAKAGIENKIEGLETGADDYLTKPFDAKELQVRSKNLISQRKNLRELFSKSEVNIDPKKVTVNSVDQRFLESLINLLEINYADPEFGVPQIQDSLAMSKTQLHRKVKALTNEPPGEVLRNFRLKRAAQLLSQKADSVTQIAYMVGFNNLSYFAKCFKQRYGTPPSSYS